MRSVPRYGTNLIQAQLVTLQAKPLLVGIEHDYLRFRFSKIVVNLWYLRYANV
jgi:hypothetical protein